MKPWACRHCHEWNAGQAKRCQICGTRRERVDVAADYEKAARQARVCAEVPGLAGVFAEIARGLRAFAAFYQIDVASIDPHTIVTPGGRVVVEINTAAT